jgi:hypothetical protein
MSHPSPAVTAEPAGPPACRAAAPSLISERRGNPDLGLASRAACPRAVMSVFKGSGQKIPPRFVVPVAVSDAGMRGGGRALSDD